LQRIYEATQVPLVLHGGSGIRHEYIQKAFRSGIAKINIATAIRQPYEANLTKSTAAAQQAVFDATTRVLSEDLGLVAAPKVNSQG
jgi:fructose-bisphosphate aldolase class II/tagatose 1,6-diphosphate aldolase GatY/KbaY